MSRRGGSAAEHRASAKSGNSCLSGIQVLSAADLATGDWAKRILALDRENMAQILRESGREFPEQRRRRVLSDPSLIVIALIDGDELAGYLDFCDDWRHAEDIYLSSIQLRPAYRHGMALARLLDPAARALSTRPFRRLRAEAQRNNTAAIALCSKLGFTVRPRADRRASCELLGERTLLRSRCLTRLMQRSARELRDGRA